MPEPSSFSLHTSSMPAITCLCPTYGRFGRLRQAVACFLLQAYPNKRLLILNDAPEPVILSTGLTITADQYLCGAEVRVINWLARFKALGHKRQALLETARTPLVAHWDDDDLYLPWHLSQCVAALEDASFKVDGRSKDANAANLPPSNFSLTSSRYHMVKPRGAWWALGSDDSFSVRGPCHNVFEGQVLFDRERALALGGYPPKVSGQAKALIQKFKKAKEFHQFDPWPFISYVYRWDDGLHHISGGGNNRKSHKAFGEKNTDFGAGKPLIPEGGDALEWARETLRPLFTQFLDSLLLRTMVAPIGPMSDKSMRGKKTKRLSTPDYDAIKDRLLSYRWEAPLE